MKFNFYANKMQSKEFLKVVNLSRAMAWLDN